MAFIDYYKTLGIPKTASADDIKKAYRKLARKLHPDINPNDKDAQTKFQKLNEANEVLSNPEKRKKYDKHGKDWEHGDEYQNQQRQHSNSGQQQYSNAGFSDDDFSDFFSSMFGNQASGNSKSQAKYRGQDLNAQFQIDIKEAYKTHKKEFTVNGKNIRITIPAGIENEQTIKIPGYGGEGLNNGPKGDLLITFSIVNTTPFKRIGNDLFLNYDLDLYKAVLGNEVIVTAFDDSKLKLKVAAGTQNGTKVRLKGKGFPIYKKEDQFGDLYVTYSIAIPKNISDKEKELFNELANLAK